MFSNYFIYSLLAPFLITDLHLQCCLASHQTKASVPLAERWTPQTALRVAVEETLSQPVLVLLFTAQVPWDRKAILTRERRITEMLLWEGF